MKQKLTELKGEINSSTIKAGQIQTDTEHSTQQQIQTDTDRQRTFYPTTTAHTFSSAHGTFPSINNMLGHK